MSDTFRKQYLSEWPEPDHKVDPASPTPWYVVGYHASSLHNVLTIDYGAACPRGGTYLVREGEMRRIYSDRDLLGVPIGTLFVLFDPLHREHREMERAIDVAKQRGFRLVALA